MTLAESPHPQRRYSAFISYRHADNTQEGRRWAEWLHRGLERYVVPPDLIGTPNLRGEPIRDSLYPIFRDEDELPANADLATGIRAALEVSDHLIVLCSPRSAVSPWVRKEVKEFKELGRSDRILAIIIAGEPNADDPAKAREGILRDEECFCEELRFGAVREDGTLDWAIRTEPLAADLRPNGTRAEGFVTAEAYREHLTLNSSLTPDKIAARTEAYRQQLDHALIKVIAGLLGVPLGQLKDRDAIHRTALAEAEATKQREIAERERQLAEQAQRAAEDAHHAKLTAERTAKRLAVAGSIAIALALLAGWFWWQAGMEKNEADRQRSTAQTQAEKARAAAMEADKQRAAAQSAFVESNQQRASAQAALAESNRQLERSQLEEGRAWLERGRAAQNKGNHSQALLLAGRALGYSGYGRNPSEDYTFAKAYPTLLGSRMSDPATENDRAKEAIQASRFIDSINPTFLPIWASRMRDSVTCVAFSLDCSRLACSSMDTRIKLWDVATGKELACLQGDTTAVASVAFSPDGRSLASGCYDQTIKLWDIATGLEFAIIRGHTAPLTSIAFSPNGSRIASASEDQTIKLWDAATGKKIASLQGHAGSVRSVAFSPDGSRLVSGSEDKSIKIWDVARAKELTCLQAHTGWVMSVVFSPDGSRIASGSYDDTIKLWDATAGKELISLQGHTGPVTGIAFSPDGSRLASGSWDDTIKLWDTETGNELARTDGHTHYVSSIAFCPDGRCIASGSSDFTAKLWDVNLGINIATRYKPSADVEETTVAFSPDGSRLAGYFGDNTIKLWDIATGKELASLMGHAGWLWNVGFSPDGSRLAVSYEDKTFKLWNVATGQELVNRSDFKIAHEWLGKMDQRWHPDGQCIAERSDNNIRIVLSKPTLDLTASLRAGLATFKNREVIFPYISQSTLMVNSQSTPRIHYRQDTLAQLADPKLTPERRAELRMELCAKSGQFRAATAQWQRLLQGEWPGFEGATVPKDQAPATIPADSPIRRLYLLALIDATKHPQIHGHPTICQTTEQIAPVLTKEMMATPTISLAMMSLMQTLAKDESADMRVPREALMKRLDEVASKEWLAVLREGK